MEHSAQNDDNSLQSILPRSPDVVVHDGIEYEAIREGLATILNQKKPTLPVIISGPEPSGRKVGAVSTQTVFYNPIQQFNRDLSVLVIRIFGNDLATIRKAKHEKKVQRGQAKALKGTKRKRDLAFDQEEPKGTKGTVDASSLNGHHGIDPPDPTIEATCTQGPQHPFDDKPVPQGPRHLDAERNGDREHREKGLFNHSFRVLDALSATGLRALRYAKEVPIITSVVANDLSETATAAIKVNVLHNELSGKVHTITGNALTHMYAAGAANWIRMPDGKPGKYDVIDLDPYGTAAPFLDAAVQALNDGGLLCVTCTDSGVFASVGYLEKTYAQYGGIPFKGPQSHEAGLRLILHAIATSAARYGMAIEPLLSLSIDFYARVFVRLRRSAIEAKFLAGKTMLVYNCDQGCGAWTTQLLANNKAMKDRKNNAVYKYVVGQGPSASPHCAHCGFKTHIAGPMWGGPLHNPYFIERILDEIPTLSKDTYATLPRIEGMLSLARDEFLSQPDPEECTDERPDLSSIPRLDPCRPESHPFFIVPSVLAKVLHCVAPSDASLRGALIKLGYRATRSHTKPGSIRTDAPWDIIWEVMREWVRQKAPVKDNAIMPGTAGKGIMQRDKSRIAVWNLKKDIQNIMDKVDDLKDAKVQIEAALYRASRCADSRVEHAAVHVVEQPTNDTEEEHVELRVEFDEELGKEVNKKKMLRYQLNPKPNWGPMTRAKGGDVAPN
ncbi:RNA methyltransferase tRNA(m5U54)methyltransferase [Lambiella insularis]|nr:RNA methyltransferase tRNA(m5U54)methyltransferase [Lambiella insularis]